MHEPDNQIKRVLSTGETFKFYSGNSGHVLRVRILFVSATFLIRETFEISFVIGNEKPVGQLSHWFCALRCSHSQGWIRISSAYARVTATSKNVSTGRNRTLTMAVSLLGMVVVVVVVAVVSVVSLLSLLLLGLAPTRSAPSSKFFPRVNLFDAGHMSDVLFALALASFWATPVVHTLASLLPVLLSLPVLQCRHLRSGRGGGGTGSKIWYLIDKIGRLFV